MKVAAALEAAESQASNGARHLSELQAGRSRASTIQNVWFVMHQSLPRTLWLSSRVWACSLAAVPHGPHFLLLPSRHACFPRCVLTRSYDRPFCVLQMYGHSPATQQGDQLGWITPRGLLCICRPGHGYFCLHDVHGLAHGAHSVQGQTLVAFHIDLHHGRAQGRAEQRVQPPDADGRRWQPVERSKLPASRSAERSCGGGGSSMRSGSRSRGGGRKEGEAAERAHPHSLGGVSVLDLSTLEPPMFPTGVW
jgi:hypothetical protein